MLLSFAFLIPLVAFLNAVAANRKYLARVDILALNKVFFNGEHNAFPDAIFFNNNFYIAFRSCPDGHMVFTSSRIIILKSKDGRRWAFNHEFSVPNRDVRDPHFVIFQGKLFLFTGTWYATDLVTPGSYEMNKQLGYSIHTDNGGHWSEPIALSGTEGYYIWKAAVYDGKVFLSARRNIDFKSMLGETPFIESVLLSSDDGFHWTEFMLLQNKFGDEVAFTINKDGLFLGVARGYGLESAALITANLFTRKILSYINLKKYIGGPMINKWGSDIIIGGREIREDRSHTTTLYLLKHNDLTKILELPSGGDCSYPGFIELSDDKAMVVYYSSHATLDDKNKSAVYVAYLYKKSA